MKNKELFKNPPMSLRPCPMTHTWPADHTGLMDAYLDYGYGGAVTNVPYGNGYTTNEDNLKRFKSIREDMKNRGLAYWIYDEDGYPSGQGAGLVLRDHPEFAAKGFYMYKRIAYAPTHVRYVPDEGTERILWAAKYPVDISKKYESYVCFDSMMTVPFTDLEVECDLGAAEVLYVFCLRDAHEGSQGTHNTYSFNKNVNIMDPNAIRRFIDLCFEPIVAAIPEAYREAAGVFTDEPSLFVEYARDYETWPYALAPWSPELFDSYRQLYGEPIEPVLPLLFEGGERGYPVRVRFYALVGRLVANAFSGQLATWVRDHGGVFSGHYLHEEEIYHHVKYYGDYIRVLSATGRPGLDVLCCFPEIYDYNTAKYPQMADRKKGHPGMMVELCPFYEKETFLKDPLNNMMCIVGLLYLAGVRKTNSYFLPDFSDYGDKSLMAYKGAINRSEAQEFNAYVGRMGAMLDGLSNQCDTFVYYALEQEQAKTVPMHICALNMHLGGTDLATRALTVPLYESGVDYYYVDREDLAEAVDGGKLTISGHTVKTILVPALDVISGESIRNLAALAQAGVQVCFADRMPSIDADTGKALEIPSILHATPLTELLNECRSNDPFGPAEEGVVLRGRFNDGERDIYMLCNRSRTDAVLPYYGNAKATIFDPRDGSESTIGFGQSVTVPAMRALFVEV